jgi:hypothetical protein
MAIEIPILPVLLLEVKPKSQPDDQKKAARNQGSLKSKLCKQYLRLYIDFPLQSVGMAMIRKKSMIE